jgi:hypothetical protein
VGRNSTESRAACLKTEAERRVIEPVELSRVLVFDVETTGIPACFDGVTGCKKEAIYSMALFANKDTKVLKSKI